jgi:hypothetical protein
MTNLRNCLVEWPMGLTVLDSSATVHNMPRSYTRNERRKTVSAVCDGGRQTQTVLSVSIHLAGLDAIQ